MQKSSSQVRAYAQVGDFITAYQALLQLAIDEVWQRIRWVERPARVKRKTPPSSILDPPLPAAQLPQWRAEQGAPGSQAEVRPHQGDARLQSARWQTAQPAQLNAAVNLYLQMEGPHDAKLERIVGGFALAGRSVRRAPMNSRGARA